MYIFFILFYHRRLTQNPLSSKYFIRLFEILTDITIAGNINLFSSLQDFEVY